MPARTIPILAGQAQRREALGTQSVARKDTVPAFNPKYGSREGHREGRARQGRRRRQEALPRPGPELEARRQDHRRRVVPRDRRRHHRRALRHLRERPASSQESFGSRGAAGPRPIDDRARSTRAPSDAPERAPEHATRLRSSAAAAAAAAAAAPRTKAIASGSRARPPSRVLRRRGLARARFYARASSDPVRLPVAHAHASTHAPAVRVRRRVRVRARERRRGGRTPARPPLPSSPPLRPGPIAIIA